MNRIKVIHQNHATALSTHLLVLIFVCGALVFFVPEMMAANPPITRIKIDTVPDEYSPTNVTMTEPVSMQEFHFEVNRETRRARVVVGYTYPDELVNERNDDAGGPRPTIAQIPGLNYDVENHEVVYESGGKRTVCARVEDRKGIFGRHLRVRGTGSCTVSAQNTKHAKDDGWAIQRFSAIDTYFEVH